MNNLHYNEKEFHCIGTLLKPHGFNGALTAFVELIRSSDYKTLKTIYIEDNGVLEPLKIEEIAPKNGQLVKLKLAGIDSEEKANALRKRKFFIQSSDLTANDKELAQALQTEGYRVFDSNLGEIGVVHQIINFDLNPILVVIFNSQEILIPVRGNFILKIDRSKKELFTDLPKDLIDLNTNKKPI